MHVDIWQTCTMNIDVQSSHQSVDFRGNFFYKVFCIDVMSKDNPSWKKFKILDSELRNKVGGRFIVRAAYGIGCLRPQPKHADKMFKFWFEIKILRPLNGSNIPQIGTLCVILSKLDNIYVLHQKQTLHCPVERFWGQNSHQNVSVPSSAKTLIKSF